MRTHLPVVFRPLSLSCTPLLLLLLPLLVTACGDDASPTDTDTAGGEATPSPARAVATISPEQVAAGEPALVACALQDADQNTLSTTGFSIIITPSDGVSIAGVELTATTPGQYKVLCRFDAAQDIAQVPATWTVTPGAPAKVELVLDPEQPGYALGQAVAVTLRTFDKQGNLTADGKVPASLEAAPASVTIEANLITFKEAGTYQLTATLPASDGGVSGTRTVLVDGEGPIITVKQPPRGLSVNGPNALTIQGTVQDALLSVDWLHFGDAPVTVSADGTFSVDTTLTYGINRLHLSAADTAGNLSETARAALWSSAHYPVNPPKMAVDGVPGGISIILTQAALDDGDHTEAQPNDIATIVEALMAGIDLQAMLGASPLGDFLNCEYLLQTFSYTHPKVTLTLADGALKMHLELSELDIKVKNSGKNKDSKWQCTLNDGGDDGPSWATGPLTFGADQMVVEATIVMTVGDSGPKADITIDKVDFTNMWGIDIPVISNIIDWTIETFVSLIKPIIANVLSSTFSDLFSAFKLDTEFALPNLAGGPPYPVAIQTDITDIQTSKESLRLYMKSLAAAGNPLRPHESQGVARFVGCEEPTPLPIDPLQPMLLGVHDDFINALLFAIWDTGMLNGKLDPSALGNFDLASMGFSDLDVSLDARLPLFLNGCGDTLRLQIGDLYLQAALKFGDVPTLIGLWIQGEVPVTLKVATTDTGAKEIGFELGSLDDLFVEVVKNEGFFAGNDKGVISLIKDLLLPQIIGSVTDGLATFPLPAIDLGTLIPGMEGVSFTLSIQKIQPKGGYLHVLGGLN